MAPTTPPDAYSLNKRLAAAFEASLGTVGTTKPNCLAVGLSGGLDSTVLVHAITVWLKITSPQSSLWAINVNHQLRSAREMQMETDLIIANCLRLKVPLSLVQLSSGQIQVMAAEQGIGMEASARHWRYRALELEMGRLGIDALLLGHHEDDDLEGQIMGFFRGQSQGKAIPPVRRQIVRPLLGFSRRDLLDYANAHQLVWSEDSTNQSAEYLRNRVRLELIPLVATIFPGYRAGLARLRQINGEDEDFLESQAAAFSWRVAANPGELLGDKQAFLGLPAAIRWRAVRQACLVLLKASRIARLPGRDFYRLFPAKPADFNHDWIAESQGLQLGWTGVTVFIRVCIVVTRKKGYLQLLTDSGVQRIPGLGTVAILSALPGGPGFQLPVVIRSLRHGDVSPDDGRSIWQSLRKQGIPAESLADTPVVVHKGRLVVVLCGRNSGRDLWFSGIDCLECDETGSGLHRVEIMDLELPT